MHPSQLVPIEMEHHFITHCANKHIQKKYDMHVHKLIFFILQLKVNGSTTNKAILTGLAPNTLYDIFVVARSANMVEGKKSNIIHINTGT